VERNRTQAVESVENPILPVENTNPANRRNKKTALQKGKHMSQPGGEKHKGGRGT